MSGTNAVAAKALLLGDASPLKALPALAGVTVAYDMPPTVPREVVYGGDIAGPVNLVAMRGTARMKREETLSLNIHIRAYVPGSETTQPSDTRVVAISTAVEEYIAANPTLGGLTGLVVVDIQNFDLSGGLDDDGATSEATLRIGLKSVLV